MRRLCQLCATFVGATPSLLELHVESVTLENEHMLSSRADMEDSVRLAPTGSSDADAAALAAAPSILRSASTFDQEKNPPIFELLKF